MPCSSFLCPNKPISCKHKQPNAASNIRVLIFNSALSRIQTSLLVSESRSGRAAQRGDFLSPEHFLPNHTHSNVSVNQKHIPQAENSSFTMKSLPWRSSSLFWKFSSQMEDDHVSPDETNRGQLLPLFIATHSY